MEQTSHLPSRGSPAQITRRRVVRLGILLLIAVGLYSLWYWRRPADPPSLPTVPLEEMEPQVVAAIEKGMERVRKNPHSADNWGFLGEILLAHSCEKQAEECFAHAAQLDDRQPRWPYYRYHSLQTRDRAAALPFLERAVTLFDEYEPEVTAPRLTLVESLLDRDLVDEADEQLRPVERREPDNPRVLFNLGVIAFHRNELPRAVECFARVAELPMARKKASAQLALLYQSLNQSERAIEYGDKARELPNDETWSDSCIDACMNLSMDSQRRVREAGRLEHSGRFRDAAFILEETARDSKSVSTQSHIATNLAQQERYPEAIDLLRKLTVQEPKMVHFQYNLGVCLYYWGEDIREKKPDEHDEPLVKFRAALPPLREAIRLKPDHALGYTFLGLTQWRLGERTEGMKALREGVHLQPVDMLTHFKLAQILEEEGQYAEALEHFQKAKRFGEKQDPRPAEAVERVRAKLKKQQK
jgi:tetratricopeptide (TPR) repeat protein